MTSDHSAAAEITLPDDSTRPEPPVLENLTPAELAPGRHLQMIHNHHRENMKMLRGLINEAAAGALSARDLAQATEQSPLVQNYRRFGALCGQHCQFVHGHHSIEDAYMFPELSEKAKGFQKVVQRLMEEHEVVHALLMQLVDAINALMQSSTPQNFRTAVEVYDKLETLLLSHFNYEERSVGPALGRFNIGV